MFISSGWSFPSTAPSTIINGLLCVNSILFAVAKSISVVPLSTTNTFSWSGTPPFTSIVTVSVSTHFAYIGVSAVIGILKSNGVVQSASTHHPRNLWPSQVGFGSGAETVCPSSTVTWLISFSPSLIKVTVYSTIIGSVNVTVTSTLVVSVCPVPPTSVPVNTKVPLYVPSSWFEFAESVTI